MLTSGLFGAKTYVRRNRSIFYTLLIQDKRIWISCKCAILPPDIGSSRSPKRSNRKERIEMDSTLTVGSLVTDRPSRAAVFEKHGIDYCCGGETPLAEACRARSLDPAAVIADLEASDGEHRAEAEPRYADMSLAELTDHIEATHHAYLRTALPRLAGLTEKVAEAHGANHPEVVELKTAYHNFHMVLNQHMAKEEAVLLPILRGMAVRAGDLHCGRVGNPIRVMMMEHDDAAADLARFRSLTGRYAPPGDACNTFRVMLRALEELEADLHRHVHLENNLLFPKALAVEASMA
jgi:regulator of cell morphogenesis and NO signaling